MRRWLEENVRILGAEYRVVETPQLLMLLCASAGAAASIKKSFEGALAKIRKALGKVAGIVPERKEAVLMIGPLDAYYAYIAHFYPEGEFPQMGGIFLNECGLPHVVIPAMDPIHARAPFVREMTHASLAHLPLPAWLNEALARRMERLVCHCRETSLDRERFARHVRCWNESTIQSFWSGESWPMPEECFELSYDLAEILWRKIEVDLGASREETLELIASANAADAGEAAIRRLFDLGLGDLASDFLGEGRWAPEPARWTERKKPQMSRKHLSPDTRLR